MNKLMLATKRFIRDEDGLTVLEYVIGAGLLVLGLTVIFTNYGNTLGAKLNSIIANI